MNITNVTMISNDKYLMCGGKRKARHDMRVLH